MAVGRRRNGIVAARDDQRGDVNFLRRCAKIGIAHGRATGDVAAGIGGLEAVSSLRNKVGAGDAEVGGKPALQCARNHRRKPFATDQIDARIPVSSLAESGRSIGQHQLEQTLGRVDSQPLAHRAAHRKPAEMGFRNPDRIEQSKDIEAECFDGERSAGNRRAPVAARIVTEDTEVSEQLRKQGLPDGQADAERVSQHQYRGAGVTAQLVVQSRFRKLKKRHRRLAQSEIRNERMVIPGSLRRCGYHRSRVCWPKLRNGRARLWSCWPGSVSEHSEQSVDHWR